MKILKKMLPFLLTFAMIFSMNTSVFANEINQLEGVTEISNDINAIFSPDGETTEEIQNRIGLPIYLQIIENIKASIPKRLKDKNGDVDLGKFNQKVKGKTAYKESGGWEIDKDTSGHGGRKWKLKNKAGERVASLDENGKVIAP